MESMCFGGKSAGLGFEDFSVRSGLKVLSGVLT